MIPKIIHYCWFGGKEIPANLRAYMETWSKYMPKWEIRHWSETNFSIADAPLYVQQAYKTQKYAFVSDYVRLWALEQYGGVYLDTDVEVIRSFNELPEFTHLCQTPLCNSFIGFEESRAKTLGTNVIGCEPHCAWVKEMLAYYEQTPFIKEDGTLDMTPNSELIARLLSKYGLVRNGKEQYVKVRGERLEDGAERLQVRGEVIHVYDFHHFSPITSTRVMRKTKDTYSIHHCYGSWTSGSKKNKIQDSFVIREFVNALIQIKRLLER